MRSGPQADNVVERLSFDRLAPKVQNVLQARVERLGYLGEFFQCTGHQPDILVAFMEMTDAERAVQRLTIAALERRGKNVAEELEAAVAAVGSDAAIAVLFLIGRYLTHAIIVNAMGLAPPVASIFAEETTT